MGKVADRATSAWAWAWDVRGDGDDFDVTFGVGRDELSGRMLGSESMGLMVNVEGLTRPTAYFDSSKI